MSESKFVKIGALWENEKGLSGQLGDARLFIFKNDKKPSEHYPDYSVCVANPIKKEAMQEKPEPNVADQLHDEIPF